jgi:glutamate synthase domain-containing protein 2
MKQRVNLYQPLLYPVTERLSLQRLVSGWLLLVGILLSGWFWLQYQQQQLAEQLAVQQQQLDVQQQEVQLYQQALQQRQPAVELTKQYELLQHRVRQKQQLLGYLAQQQQQAGQLYSPVLAHLLQIDRRELWLTAFSLQQQHSSFSGISLQPDKVPLWLDDLRRLDYFKGQRFSEVNMLQVPQQSAVSFQLVAQQGGSL